MLEYSIKDKHGIGYGRLFYHGTCYKDNGRLFCYESIEIEVTL